MVWLDLANAYGSILHQLIQVDVHQYYIQDHVSNIFMNYFNNIHIRFLSIRFTKKGIVTGRHHLCHIVRHGLNMIIKAAIMGVKRHQGKD